MSSDEEIDADERALRARMRADAKQGIKEPWAVERHDNGDGSISYEVWSGGYKHRVCRICERDNPTAKRDAEHIVELHNAALGHPVRKGSE